MKIAAYTLLILAFVPEAFALDAPKVNYQCNFQTNGSEAGKSYPAVEFSLERCVEDNLIVYRHTGTCNKLPTAVPIIEDGSNGTTISSMIAVRPTPLGLAGIELLDLQFEGQYNGSSILVIAHTNFIQTANGQAFDLVAQSQRYSYADGSNAVSDGRCWITVTLPKPDLVVTKISVPSKGLRPGTVVNFSASFKNQSDAYAGAHKLSFYLDGNKFTTIDVAPLKGGEERAFTAPAGWTSTIGAHKLQAVIDDTNVIEEDNETNNSYTGSFIIDRPLPMPMPSLMSRPDLY